MYDFENFGHVQFTAPGLCIRQLATLALESPESGWTIDDGPIDELSQSVVDILIEKANILREYYSFDISSDGCLLQLPVLLGVCYVSNNTSISINGCRFTYPPENHQLSLAHLPMYILRLATEVDWSDECEFFETFSRETATFYATIPYASSVSNEEDNDDDSWKWHVEHVVYAALKEFLLPPKHFMNNKSFLVVASLPKLYKVFERC